MVKFTSNHAHNGHNRCEHASKFWDQKPSVERSVIVAKAEEKTKAQLEAELESLMLEIKPELKEAFLKEVKKMRGNIDIAALMEAYDTLSLNEAYQATRIDETQAKMSTLEKAIAAALILAALRAKPIFKRTVEEENKRQTFIRFNRRDASVQKYINRYTAEKVTGINQATRKTIQEIFLNAYEKGHTRERVASDIRAMIGLSPRQARAVQNRREKLIKSGFSGKRLEDAVEAYIKKSLDYRAEMIARTESSFIVNRGMKVIVQENFEQTMINGQVLYKRWVTRRWDRVCPECLALEGKVVPFNEPFTPFYSEPPVHPNCQCSYDVFYGEPKND